MFFLSTYSNTARVYEEQCHLAGVGLYYLTTHVYPENMAVNTDIFS
jgi:hypothetical protein